MSAEEAASALVAYVRSEWDRTHKAVLLSHAGSFLTRKRLWPIPEKPVSLSLFVENELAGGVRIERRPDNPLHFGLFPADAKLQEDLSTYFAKSNVAEGPRYSPYVWAAFAKTIPNGHRRFLNLTRHKFLDADNVTQSEPGWVEVLSSDIPPEGGEKRISEIESAIHKWAERNGIDRGQLLVGNRTEVQRQPVRYQSLLDFFLEALTDKELVRIEMPLDIVAKLRRHRI